MEPNLRDTPLRRFNTFFWGLGLFALFGALCFAISAWLDAPQKTVEDLKTPARVATKLKVDSDQAKALDVKVLVKGKTAQVRPENVFNMMSAEILNAKQVKSSKKALTK